jgi:hypothetical protein
MLRLELLCLPGICPSSPPAGIRYGETFSHLVSSSRKDWTVARSVRPRMQSDFGSLVCGKGEQR